MPPTAQVFAKPGAAVADAGFAKKDPPFTRTDRPYARLTLARFNHGCSRPGNQP